MSSYIVNSCREIGNSLLTIIIFSGEALLCDMFETIVFKICSNLSLVFDIIVNYVFNISNGFFYCL